MAARGPRFFRIKKTKGHALDHKEFLEKYPHLRWEAVHNNTVDRLANAARYNFFNKQHIHLSGILVKRASKYVDFVIHVHNVIFKMHIFLQQLRLHEASPMAVAMSTPNNILHVCPDLVFDSTPLPLDFKVDRCELNQLLVDQPSPILGLAELLMRCLFAYNDKSAGLTWHELYILTAAVSNDPQIFCRSTAAASKPIHLQVREFAIKATALVKACLNAESQRPFQITKVGANRMLFYGHMRRLPHTLSWPLCFVQKL